MLLDQFIKQSMAWFVCRGVHYIQKTKLSPTKSVFFVSISYSPSYNWHHNNWAHLQAFAKQPSHEKSMCGKHDVTMFVPCLVEVKAWLFAWLLTKNEHMTLKLSQHRPKWIFLQLAPGLYLTFNLWNCQDPLLTLHICSVFFLVVKVIKNTQTRDEHHTSINRLPFICLLGFI